MKVLLIDVNCKYSSTGKIVYELFQKLKEERCEVAVAYGRGEAINEEGIYKFGLDLETIIHAGLARITGLNGYFSPLSTRRLIKFIENFQPDIIHIHELHAYFVSIKPLIDYIKLKKIKVVWTFHCEYMYTGKCGHAYNCINFTKECGHCPAIRSYPKSIFFDRTKKMLRDKKVLLKDMDFTIAVPSQWLADRVRMSFLKDKEIKIIYNGIDNKNVFYPRDTSELRETLGLQNKKIILSVAPNIMEKRKGGKWVLRLANKLKKSDLYFILVGAKKEEEHEGSNYKIFSQEKDAKKLAQFYSLADVFLLCSEKETFSMTCAEALCCGTPVVGFKSGAPETIAIPEYSKFVEYGELDQLEEAVKQFLSKKTTENVKIIVEKAREKYSSQIMLKNYIALYQE